MSNRRPWLDRVLDTVADRGRELLNRSAGRAGRPRVRRLEAVCDHLLAEPGEASALAIARELIERYEAMTATERLEFFDTLLRRYGPDVDTVRAAAEAYLAEGDTRTLQQLTAAVEPPRRELLRRMNMVPGGTRAVVTMRAHLLRALREHPELRVVDADFKHLLTAWFNRGFLSLERIDWQSPAQVLEQLIRYEAVHAVRGWEDLRRRLAPDRRCFAFFHPALRGEPLIFVEVALVKGLTDRIGPLLELETPVLPPDRADTAIFYSISNTQRGLRGISFGNFLLKQVVADLGQEFENLRTFATLSPLPHFESVLTAAAADRHPVFTRARFDALLGEELRERLGPSGRREPLLALRKLVEETQDQPPAELTAALNRLALAYLTQLPRGGPGFDRVAAFHLSNGARLERINAFADVSAEGLRASLGVMANYLYDPEELEANHERFVAHGEIRMSRSLGRLEQRVAAAWGRELEQEADA